MTPRRPTLALAGAGLLLATQPACISGSTLRARAAGLDEQIAKVEGPARRCAERELAMSKSHLKFAELELEEGAYFRAKEHMDTAVDFYRQADVRSRGACNADRDGDGIPDAVDSCPDQPEDFNNFQDEDGCPDGDRDGDGLQDYRDRCPNDPGPPENEGCPALVRDRDRDGIADASDRCPDDPEDIDGFQDEDGCPDPDNDADGLPDHVDKCPDEPEDFDGHQDQDGCPDPDNDGDGIADLRDRCPNEPGPEERQGCPAVYQNIIVRDDRIELKQTVHFATGRDKILPKSYGLLNEVAQALRDNPGVSVRIEGHTDSQGAAGANLELSRRRAHSVRRYLVDQGIAPERMESVGHGEDRPIEDNRTASGRAANRRVEFHLNRR